jgi:methylphosphotriester-DNA--protein-cysteine methyltransferase
MGQILPDGRVDLIWSADGSAWPPGRRRARRPGRWVGYGPRTLGRVPRFQRLLAGLRRPATGSEPLARLALNAGYADQAHMSREARRLSGLTPSALAALLTDPGPRR